MDTLIQILIRLFTPRDPQSGAYTSAGDDWQQRK